MFSAGTMGTMGLCCAVFLEMPESEAIKASDD